MISEKYRFPGVGKWCVYKPEVRLGNNTFKILWDFNFQSDRRKTKARKTGTLDIERK